MSTTLSEVSTSPSVSRSSSRPSAPFRTHTAAMGQPNMSLDRALQIAAELEDDVLVARSTPVKVIW